MSERTADLPHAPTPPAQRLARQATGKAGDTSRRQCNLRLTRISLLICPIKLEASLPWGYKP